MFLILIKLIRRKKERREERSLYLRIRVKLKAIKIISKREGEESPVTASHSAPSFLGLKGPNQSPQIRIRLRTILAWKGLA